MTAPRTGIEPRVHPPVPDIPSGLTHLPRQLAGFDEYRDAMLSAIGAADALNGWRGRARFDLGVMLVEWWAYVLDVTSFYDERIAERSYIQTSIDEATTTELVSLLGHRPRPAMGATVKLAVTALGDDPVTLPAGSAFRSDSFDDEVAHIFELNQDTTIWPERNQWTLAPVRDDSFDGVNIWVGARRSPHVGAVVLIQADDGASSKRAAGLVAEVLSERAADDARYQRVVLRDQDQSGLGALKGLALPSLSLMRVSLGLTPHKVLGRVAMIEPDQFVLQLESLYSVNDQVVVVEIDGTLHISDVVSTQTRGVEVPTAGDPVVVQVTELTLRGAIPKPTSTTRVHVSALDLGRVTQPARTTLTKEHLSSSGQAGVLQNPVRSLRDAPAAGQVIAQGSRDRGQLLSGTLSGDGSPDARLQIDPSTTAFAQDLAPPIRLFGNVIEVTRGETVLDELLGFGDATAQFLTLALGNQPLTWLEDPATEEGRQPELVVRVDGVEWKRVDSFFHAGPSDRVFRVDLNAAQESSVVFGGDGFGQVPGTGAEIRADYRYGAGAATPPARGVTRTAGAIDGLDLVVTSLAATGGADPETIDELKTAAPAATLTLGRAVSLLDFEALARSYANVLNASAGWAWDFGNQRASAKIWIIPAAGDPSNDLAAWLRNQAAPDLVVTVEAARSAAVSSLAVNLDIMAGYNRGVVAQRVRSALFDDQTGLLAARNIRIGAPLFRSVITERIHTVEGVRSVSSILLDGDPMPTGLKAEPGEWFDFTETAQVQ